MMNRAKFRRMLVADKLITNYFKNPTVTRLKRLTGHDHRYFEPKRTYFNPAYRFLVHGDITECTIVKPPSYTRWHVRAEHGYIPLFDY